MKIKVTQQHIDCSSRGSNVHCPVANAAKEATGKHVSVGCNTIVVDYVNRFLLPEEERRRICRFDLGFAMEPHEFEFPWEGA